MSKMKDVLIGTAERLASEKKIDIDTAEDLIRNGEVFGDKDMKWIADYAAGKEEKKMYQYYLNGRKKPLGLQYVVAPTREKAIEWERRLKESIRKYGKVTVSQLYELTAEFPNPIKPIFPDFSYGWTKEEDIHYVANADGYWFNLSTPINLDKLECSKNQKPNKVKVYLAVENDPCWSSAEVLSVFPTYYDALELVYAKASFLLDTCQREKGHHPTLSYVAEAYLVDDEYDDIHRRFYVEVKEVEV